MIETRKNRRDTRLEFEKDLNILGELINQGRIHFSEKTTKSIDGIKKVRYAPNHRIDLNTVDEMARTLAMGPMMDGFKTDENEKK